MESDITQNSPEIDAQVDAAPTITLAEVEKLKADLAAAQAKAAENLDGWQRARAEFANFKKRQESEASAVRAFAATALLQRLLPVLDDFDRASKTLPESLRGMTWIDGMLLIYRKMQLVLENEGVKPIEIKPHDMFDPNMHEAVSHEDAEGVESGHVIDELQKGYKLGDRILRPVLVRVAR